MSRFQLFKNNLLQLFISIDQVLRCIVGLFVGLINGHSQAFADETLSAWAYRSEERGSKHGKALRLFIDAIMFIPEGFQWNHCKTAYQSELDRKHSPK